MSDIPRKTLGKTKKKYTVIFQCRDPAVPISITHTNNLKTARQVYDAWKGQESTPPIFGDWNVTLWEHTAKTTAPEIMTTASVLPALWNGPYIYNAEYPGSLMVARYSYQDAWDDITEKEMADAQDPLGSAPSLGG